MCGNTPPNVPRGCQNTSWPSDADVALTPPNSVRKAALEAYNVQSAKA
jgi:hypothetical protein